MKILLITLTLAFTLILFALFLLGIGRILTGKSKLRIGMCGRVPSKKCTKEEKSSCSLCGNGEEEKTDQND